MIALDWKTISRRFSLTRLGTAKSGSWGPALEKSRREVVRGLRQAMEIEVRAAQYGYLKVAATGEVTYSVEQFAGDFAALSVEGRSCSG